MMGFMFTLLEFEGFLFFFREVDGIPLYLKLPEFRIGLSLSLSLARVSDLDLVVQPFGQCLRELCGDFDRLQCSGAVENERTSERACSSVVSMVAIQQGSVNVCMFCRLGLNVDICRLLIIYISPPMFCHVLFD